MLRSLDLVNFRTFREFSMSSLGRINLCVGTNNCGKTSVLEAISILASQGRPEALWAALARRGEHWFEEDARGASRREVDVCQLFHGRNLSADNSFYIRATNDRQAQEVTASLVDSATIDSSSRTPDDSPAQEVLFDLADSEEPLGPRLSLALSWRGSSSAFGQLIQLSRRGGLRPDAVDRSQRKRQDDGAPVRLITTEAIKRDELVAMFETVVLTPEEDVTVDALRTIEPDIERIAPIGTERRLYGHDRGGFAVKLRGSAQRIPIGSMGDGIWRMLGIALSLARSQGGILLVDEIDTGLHYSVMANMWKMVLQTAERLDVQVFATTHSRDCYESLAAISRADVATNGRVSIQRIERGNPRAVAFSEQEIVIAAERAIEVR